MLTAGQCVTAAYMTDGGLVCPDCANKLIEEYQSENGITYETEYGAALAEYTKKCGTPDLWRKDRIAREVEEKMEAAACEALDMQPIIQYTLDSKWGEMGATCDNCDTLLVEGEPSEDETYDEDLDDETGEAQ